MSDSDSDDSLLGGPVFSVKRKSRTETAREKKRNNLLDGMLTQQEERINQRKRIDETIKKEQEEYRKESEKPENDNAANIDSSGSSIGIKQETDVNVTSRKFVYNPDDPNIQKRLEEMKAKTREDDLNPHERRKRLKMELDGIDDVHFDPDGEMSNYSEEESERRLAQIAGRHCTLGMRHILGCKYEEAKIERSASIFKTYECLEDAMKDLNVILKIYSHPPQARWPNEQKEEWKKTQHEITIPLKRASDKNILSHMLSKKSWKEHLVVPEELITWLLRVSITGSSLLGSDICTAASSMLSTLIHSDMKIISKDGSNIVPSKLCCINEFTVMLQENFGMRTEKYVSNPPQNYIQSVKFDETLGLKHALSFWVEALTKNWVSFSNLDETKNMIQDALVASMIIGADPIFHDGNELLKLQGKLISVLLRTMHNIFQKTVSSETINCAFSEWSQLCAQKILSHCRLYCKLPNVSQDDERDTDEWMMLEVVMRSWSHVKEKYESILIFYSSFCEIALGSALAESIDLSQKVTSMLESDWKVDLEHVPIRYKTIGTANTVIKLLSEPSSEYLVENSRLLALVRIAVICDQVGIELFSHNIQKSGISSSTRGFCESDEEAGLLFDHFDNMSQGMKFLKTRIRVVIGKQYFMKTKELALAMASFYESRRETVKGWNKSRKSLVTERRQSDMSVFLKPVKEEGFD